MGRCRASNGGREHTWVLGEHPEKHTTENAAMLPNRFDKHTASGVRCVINRSGRTGISAHRASMRTKNTANTALATNKPQMIGWAQGSCSLSLRLNPRRSVPTVVASVAEPKKSMRRSFSDQGCAWSSSESGIETLSDTRTMEKMRTGIWKRNAARLDGVSGVNGNF
jgi:hypothetical protein